MALAAGGSLEHWGRVLEEEMHIREETLRGTYSFRNT